MLISATADLTVGLQNASLVAQALGYGTVMLGGVLNGSLEIAQELGLPPRVVPLIGLSVGRPKGRHWPAPRPRLPLRLLVHHEAWTLDEDAERALLAGTTPRRAPEATSRADASRGRRWAWAATTRCRRGVRLARAHRPQAGPGHLGPAGRQGRRRPAGAGAAGARHRRRRRRSHPSPIGTLMTRSRWFAGPSSARRS
jgi:hypothetical protein